MVALLCTGEFELVGGKGLLVRPQPILYNVTKAVADGLKVGGVVSPAADQIPQSKKRWQQVGGTEQVMVAASPYGDVAELEKAADALKRQQVQLVVLDCMGYTLAMQEKVRQITGAPVILARGGILPGVLKELIGGVKGSRLMDYKYGEDCRASFAAEFSLKGRGGTTADNRR